MCVCVWGVGVVVLGRQSLGAKTVRAEGKCMHTGFASKKNCSQKRATRVRKEFA